MSNEQQLNTSDAENLCVVCFKNVDFYSIGVCDHPVCFECSTRMRVLCKQNECPICRQDMPKVIFTKYVEPYKMLFRKFERCNMQDRKYGLIFCTYEIQKAYKKLLEHRCLVCVDEQEKRISFAQFEHLKDHMRREHSLFYCELCTENLKIFTSERRTYNRQQLALHRRKGDPDNTSHRGHPLCEFCDQRFMDNDDLFRHMRRVHMFCHFCDADGRHLYYPNLHDLKLHFKEEHFFCEEGECAENPLTSVFRTEIDYKGHVAREHSRHMSKAAGKQARTLDIEFMVAPRARSGPGSRFSNRRDRVEDEGDVEPGGPGDGQSEAQFFNSLSSENFPSLGGVSAAPQRPLTTVNFTSKMNRLKGAEFPTLGSTVNRPGSAVTITTNSASSRPNRPPEVTITRTIRNPPSSSREDFPVLGGQPSGSSTVRLSMKKPQDSSLSIQVNHKSNGAITTHITTSKPSTDAFPALGKSAPVTQPQWVQQKPKKQQQQDPKSHKVAQAPVLPPSDLQQFPTLSKGGKSKKTSVTVPVSQSWVNLNDMKNKPTTSKPEQKPNKNNKKKKSKNDDTNNNNTEEIPKNGIVKKRSELKIGSLSLTGESSQISTPPPGFSVKPPPGFQGANFPSLGSNNLTFTNSTGQSYAITPNDDYRPPNNFPTRNQNLITRFKKILNENSFGDFKKYSELFRRNELSAKNYYERCKEILDVNFDNVFPELLVLLPDIEKQQELYAVYEGKSKKQLDTCLNCKQVIFKKELTEHYGYHTLDNHFASLGKAQQLTDNAWKK